ELHFKVGFLSRRHLSFFGQEKFVLFARELLNWAVHDPNISRPKFGLLVSAMKEDLKPILKNKIDEIVAQIASEPEVVSSPRSIEAREILRLLGSKRSDLAAPSVKSLVKKLTRRTNLNAVLDGQYGRAVALLTMEGLLKDMPWGPEFQEELE